PVPDPMLEALLEGGARLAAPPSTIASVAELDVLAAAARSADLAPVRATLAYAVRLLRKNGIQLGDRRIVKVQKLVAAAAAFAGRRTPTDADLWPIVVAVPGRDAQTAARDVLRSVLDAAQNEALAAAALEASHGPLARARRILEAGEAILRDPPHRDDADAI